MALTKTLTLQNNFGTDTVLEDVYIKVFRVSADKTRAVAEVHLLPNSEGQPYAMDQHEFEPDLEGSNFIKQAYLHLKTLPEFEGAVDC